MSDDAQWCNCYQRDPGGGFSRGPRPKEECEVLREFGGGKLNKPAGRELALAAYNAEIRRGPTRGER